MERNKLLKRVVVLVFFIFFINYLATAFYWYTSVWWFDMPMHFLGGFWIGLVCIWFFSSKEISLPVLAKIILLVLIIGVGWELFEILVNSFLAKNSFNILDTLSDIFFDLAGGTAALLYFLRKILPKVVNKVQ